MTECKVVSFCSFGQLPPCYLMRSYFNQFMLTSLNTRTMTIYSHRQFPFGPNLKWAQAQPDSQLTSKEKRSRGWDADREWKETKDFQLNTFYVYIDCYLIRVLLLLSSSPFVISAFWLLFVFKYEKLVEVGAESEWTLEFKNVEFWNG